MEKKSFVLTGYVQRNTCACGCITSNCFHLDGGFGGAPNLAKLHPAIERYLDELSGAGPQGSGKAFDVKVTVTIEPLGAHDHHAVNKHSFHGDELEEHVRLMERLLAPSEPSESPVELKGEDEMGPEHVEFLRKIHGKD
jgi:hypothetical protein